MNLEERLKLIQFEEPTTEEKKIIQNLSNIVEEDTISLEDYVKSKNLKSVHLRLAPIIKEQAIELANEQGLSLNQFIGTAVAYFVGLNSKNMNS